MKLEHAAHGKINLFLHVTGKRADGYHLLESLISFAALHDKVTVESADALTLTVTGPFAEGLQSDVEENILLKTARLLATQANKEPLAHITLEKNLPVGAGIGGGSADAAALMHLLHRLWELPFPKKEMLDLALKIGADVPICYVNQTAFIAGIGENITPSPFPLQLFAVLVNPLQPLSTIAVFKQGVPHFSPATTTARHIPSEADTFIRWLHTHHNDLETPACQLMPVIPAILAELKNQPDCLLARMSGSGATCFGLFRDQETAVNAAGAIGRNHPEWWAKNTVIGNV